MRIRRATRRALAVAAGVAVVAGVAVPTATAATTADRPTDAKRARMEALLNGLRRDTYTAPGAAITFGDGHHDVTLSSGSRDALVHHPIESDDAVRVGSDTKMFVASVVLQLVGEGRVVLDAPIDRYLPGVLRYPADKVPGNPAAYDGRTVTVRQLLQHTAGLPDYGTDYAFLLNPVFQVAPPTPQDVVAYGLAKGPVARPGARWQYSNTGYAILGMLIQRITGHRLSTEIADRIARPLGLKGTFYAEAGQKGLPADHVHGYLNELVLVDFSSFEPAIWGAAGALVSTADDMDTFLSALLAGKVLRPAQLREMQRTVPYLDGGYGLGIVSTPLPCGMAWGHAGFLAGYYTFGLALPNGRHAFMTFNSTIPMPLSAPANPRAAFDLMELALC
jgi:D-alanyl-D-alanine carboxypeptidase